MKALPFVAAVIVLASIAGAVIFAAHGSWLVAGLLVVGAVAMAAVLRAVARRAWREPPAAPGYVQRESHYF